MKTNAFCTFCSLPQKVYAKKHIHILEILAFGVVGALGTYLIWGDFHMAGPVAFFTCILSSEVVHQMRWRQSVACRSCGFDPLLYKKNPVAAADKVKVFLDNRKQDPRYLLKPQPQIKPIIKKVHTLSRDKRDAYFDAPN